jgi:hypothetical protein
MGTRADFYVDRGEDAEWLGSIAWDGYPDGIEEHHIIECETQEEYRAAVQKMLEERDDATKPEQGWPWPWDDSRTTDYAYAFDQGRVWACPYGYDWYLATDEEPDEESEEGAEFFSVKRVIFPNMKAIQNVDFGERSGTMIIGLNEPTDDGPDPSE